MQTVQPCVTIGSYIWAQDRLPYDEFTLRLDDYAALGGHVDEIRPLAEVVAQNARRPYTVFAHGAVERAQMRRVP